MSENPEERVCIQVYLSSCFAGKVRSVAKKMNVSMSSLVKIALDEYREAHPIRWGDAVPIPAKDIKPKPKFEVNLNDVAIEELEDEVNDILGGVAQGHD